MRAAAVFAVIYGKYIVEVLPWRKMDQAAAVVDCVTDQIFRYRLYQWRHLAGQGKPPAGNLSVISAGELPQIEDTPMRVRPKHVLF
jgi:hypothetical protein